MSSSFSKSLLSTSTVRSGVSGGKIVANITETKTTDTGSNVMKPLIYGTAAAAVLFIGVVIVMWMIKERRKRIKKLELLESLEKEKTGKKRKRKRRHRRTRGPKPVIKVKQSEKLKKALADYLEMHTQTIGSRRSWW
ncbi:hypothetical protein RB195_005920 [Necator americanus]|uniref:Transmembrane protein n=1 Tax=Necator americanus TaxID=51031 RepID=A0ABR1BQB0_NECAM